MPNYKIAGKIQKITYNNNSSALVLSSISILPDADYTLKDGEKNYAVLLPTNDNGCQVIGGKYDKEIEIQLASGANISVCPGKRVEIGFDMALTPNFADTKIEEIIKNLTIKSVALIS